MQSAFLPSAVVILVLGLLGCSAGPSDSAISQDSQPPASGAQQGIAGLDGASFEREPARYESENVDCTIPGFISVEDVSDADVMRAMELNVPKENPEHCYVFTDSIPKDLRRYHEEVHQKLIDYVGGYDRYVHILWDPADDLDEARSTLQELQWTWYSSEGVRQDDYEFLTADVLYENRACLVNFLPRDGFESSTRVNLSSFCNQPNPITNPDWEGDRKMYSDEVFLFQVMNGWVHEYYHHVQNAHLLDRENAMYDDCCGLGDLPIGSPAWFVEGQAIVFPALFFRDLYDEFEIVKEHNLEGTCLESVSLNDQSLAGRMARMADCNLLTDYGHARDMLQGRVDYAPDCNGFGPLEEYRETSVCHGPVWPMFNYYLAYRSSYQTLFNDLHQDLWALEFDAAFEKNFGFTKEQAYEEFTEFMADNPAPPEGFFPDQRLDELVDFWSISSAQK